MSDTEKISLRDKARKMRNEYQRRWYKAHPDKRKEYMSRYWEKKAQELELDEGSADQ